MIPNAAMAGTVRRAASLGLALVCCASPALAGDRALVDFLGYSEDGRYFSFEEYGTQDGSGFPYANIFIVDLPADTWPAGTPIRVRLDDEGASVADARSKARSQAEDQLDERGIGVSAHLIALNGDGEPGDGQSLDFGAVGFLPHNVTGAYRLSLEQFDSGSPEDCLSFVGAPPKGYALTLEGGGESRELHRDGDLLPRSRGCATGYRIYGVVAPADSGTLDDAVAIVSVFPFGFEGPDRRFIAVPLGE